MYPSLIITTAIRRPVAEVYEFLAEPLNAAAWHGQVRRISHKQHRDWLVNLEGTEVVVRVSPKNAFGVLDTWVMPPGRSAHLVPVRVYPNGDGTELAWTLYQRPGISEERFQSEAEWIRTDLLSLKTLLEAANERPAVPRRVGPTIWPAPR